MSDIRKSLGFPHEDDFVSLLSSRSITIEQLIISFFSSAQPFANMMSELLNMFQRAGATHSQHNLQIKFDFSNDSSQLSFDLEHFRSTLATWKKVSGVWLQRQWTLNLLVELLNAIGGNAQAQKRIPTKNSTEDWIKKYKLEGKFPGFYPPTPVSGIPWLDERIDVVWEIWKTVVKRCEPFDSEHRLLGLGLPNYAEGPEHEEKQGFDQWPFEEIRILRANIIVSHFLDGDYYLVVHKYSGEAPLNLSQASVTLTGRFDHKFTCPSSGEGDYWIVCRISPSTNKVQSINTIEDRRPW